MTFKTSLDKLSIVITISVTIIFALIIIGQYATIRDGDKTIPNYITFVLLLIHSIAFSFWPKSYTLNTDKLIINRPLINVKINRSDIKSVEQIGKDKLRYTFRMFGVGGLFGYYGNFVNSTLGSMTWYATRRDKAVLITTLENKKIIVTPDSPEEFVASFNS